MTSIRERINRVRKNFKSPTEWLMDRTHIDRLPLRKTPDYMRTWGGKWYWTGALITIAFTYEVLTGLVLLLYYNPAPIVRASRSTPMIHCNSLGFLYAPTK